MRPHEVYLRINAANDVLRDIGASSILGSLNGNDSIEYNYIDGTKLVFAPLETSEDSDGS